MSTDLERLLGPARPGQQEAVGTVVQRVLAGDATTSLVLPTRYGKTDTARLATTYLLREGRVSGGLILEPNVRMRSQVCPMRTGPPTEWDEFVRRYGAEWDMPYRALKTLELDPFVNGERFLSMTMQSLHSQIDFVMDWIDKRVRQANALPLLLFIDECQMYGNQAAWDRDVERLMSRCHVHTVLMTALAMRADKRTIRGFQTETSKEREVRFNLVRPHETDPEKVLVEAYAGSSALVSLVADCTVTFRQAWDEEPSSLCKLSHVKLDVRMSEVLGDESDTRMLSELSAQDARSALPKAVRDPKVIRAGVALLLRQVHNLRRGGHGQARGMIFVGNDDDAEVNKYASLVRRIALTEMHAQGITLPVSIVTQEQDDASDMLESFCSETGGDGGIVILKMMAGVGITARPAKVLLDLSTMRQPASMIQRWMRVATPWGRLRTATLITLADQRSVEVFDWLADQGGALEQRVTDVEKVDEYEADKQEPKEKSVWEVDGVQVASVSDSQGRSASAPKLEFIHAITELVPELAGTDTEVGLIERFEGFEITRRPVADVSASNLEFEILRKRDEVNDLAEKILRRQAQMDPDVARVTPYGDRRSAVFVRMYRVAGVRLGQELRTISDLKLLERICAEGKRWLDELRSKQSV